MRRMQRARLPILVVICVGIAALLAAGGPAAAATPTVTQPGHVFLIELENESYNSTYVDNPNPYLGKTLQAQGQLLTQYYAVGHESNDNYLAQLSGQAPNPETQGDCQLYTDFQPSPAVLDSHGQAIGAGCVFPSNVLTLPNQLTATGHTWKAYMQDMGNTAAREESTCGTPGSSAGVGTKDGTQTATAADQYAARHNPFVYFHAIVDSPACKTNVVPLTDLSADLAHPSDFTWITPNLCSDGHDDPCVGKNEAGGLVAVDAFLKTYVPMIEASPAFQQNGLLIITSDESATSDTSSCCHAVPGPNSPLPGITGGGGGLIGTLLIGHCVEPGTKNATPYNHYATLRSLEDAFGITTGGADGKGHLGFAGTAGLTSFGTDVFGGCAAAPPTAGAGGGSSGRPTSPAVGAAESTAPSVSNSTTSGAGSLAFTGLERPIPIAALVLIAVGAGAWRLRRRH